MNDRKTFIKVTSKYVVDFLDVKVVAVHCNWQDHAWYAPIMSGQRKQYKFGFDECH